MALPIQANDPYADTGAIKELVEKKYKEWSRPRPRRPFLMAAERNIRFKLGDQWIRPAPGGTIGWRPAVLKKGTPTPVTNVYAYSMKAFESMLARYEPALSYRPATDDAEDRATADVSDRVIEAIEDETEIEIVRQQMAGWVTHTGGAWIETGWDASPLTGTVEIPMLACQTEGCGYLAAPQESPAQEAAESPPDAFSGLNPINPINAPGMSEQAAPGPSCPKCGASLGEQMIPMPKGRMYAEAANLFEMFFDPTVTNPMKHTALLRQRSVDIDVAKQRWPEVADSIQADSTANTYLTSEGLTAITPNIDDTTNARSVWGQGQGSLINTRVTENWYWQMPDQKYPEGLLAVVLGKSLSQCVYAGPLPYYAQNADGTREPFLPFVFFPQELIPGHAWPKTVANDVALKQTQRNQWEALILMSGQRMSNPVWLNPRGSDAKLLTGEPGQIVDYNAIGPSAAKPERIPGLPINQTWMLNIERIDKEIQSLSYTFDVLRGEHPPGISAGITLQILKERGESQYGPMFRLWNYSWAEWSRQALEIFRMFATEPRLLRIKGRDGGWEVSKFMAADLRGRIDVIPEAGVSLPKSTMTERAEIEQALTIGALNIADPETRFGVIQKFGLTSMMPTMKADTRNAFKENEMFRALAMAPTIQQAGLQRDLAGLSVVDKIKQTIQLTQQAGAPPTVVLAQVEQMFAQAGLPVPKLKPAIDDHAVHGREHRRDAKSEDFDQRPEILQVFEELHIAAHDFLQGQQMMALRAMQTGNPQGGFLARPGPPHGSPPSTTASQGASSAAGLDGQQQEMEQRLA